MFSKSSLVTVVALSLSAACNSPRTEPPAPAPKPAVTVAKAPEPAVAAQPAPITAAVAIAPSPAPAKHAATKSGLVVKRFVVASAIENREPVALDTAKLGELPLFAFAELANGGDAEQVVITFERDGSSETVGHVELSVPGATQRWRTWGKTNLIGKPGSWDAVLRDQSGKELARTRFEVTEG